MGPRIPRSESDGGRKMATRRHNRCEDEYHRTYFVSVGHECGCQSISVALFDASAPLEGLVSLHSHDFFVILPLFARIQGYRRNGRFDSVRVEVAFDSTFVRISFLNV